MTYIDFSKEVPQPGSGGNKDQKPWLLDYLERNKKKKLARPAGADVPRYAGM